MTGGDDLTRGGSYRGVEGWEDYRRDAHETWRSLKAEAVTIDDLGDGVVTAEVVVSGVGRSSNATVAMPGHAVCVVRDGRLASAHIFQSAEEARRYTDELLAAG